ncbi:MAG: DRTGG domain-containing protein [Dehalococcoidia bacterium]
MALIAITSQQPGAGKTAVAAAVARHFAHLGTRVTLARVADGDRAASDAEFFASLDFAPGSPASPREAASIADPGSGRLLVVECGPEAAAALADAKVVLAARGSAPDAVPEGVPLAGIVVTAVPRSSMGAMPADITGAPVISLEEDRTLAGFSVSEIRAMLRAELLVEGDNGDPSSDYLVVAPIGSDAGQPYFMRFPSKAVVGRFDKTDMHLAALRADTNVLVLSGGRYPSDYVYDAARSMGVPVLLSATDTENTVIALEGIWDHTRFFGERKLARMAELLEGSRLFGALETPQP